MSRRMAVLPVLAALLAFGAVACGGDTEVLTAQPATGISVQGTGEVTAPTDTGIITIGVQVTADTVAEARDRAAEAMNGVVGAAKDNGVEDDDIRTVQFSVSPRYEYRKEETVLIGFEVTNLVEVKVRDLEAFPAVLDDAIKAGGDDARISGIQFTIEDTAALLERARELAMEDAKSKAEQLADLGDVKLGKPITISESQSTNLPPEVIDGRDAADGGSTPVQPGSGSIRVSVTVLYGISD